MFRPGPIMWHPKHDLFGIGKNFNEPVRRVHRGATIRHKRKLSGFVINTGSLQLLFGLPDTGHFRPSINNPRNKIIIDMTRLPYRKISANTTPSSSALCANMDPRSHRNRINSGHIGLEMGISLNPSTHHVQHQPHKPQTISIGFAPNCDRTHRPSKFLLHHRLQIPIPSPPFLSASALETFVESLNIIPCLVKFFAFLWTIQHPLLQDLSIYSMTITSESQTPQTAPSSRPITPPPITTSF